VINRVHSFVLQGIDAVRCEIEADLSPAGLPKTTIVGLPDAAVKESAERVRTALLNSGFRYPQNRVTINLAPADVRKEGPVYDLPIALALLLAGGAVTPGMENGQPRTASYIMAGELALDGRVRPIKGAVSLALLAKSKNAPGVIVPIHNAPEAAAVDGIDVIGVESLPQLVGFLNGNEHIEPYPTVDLDALIAQNQTSIDFADVRGQEAAKHALTVAAAGGHNVLMIGPAGTGKTMMAKALPGVLPALTRGEALELTRIYSSIGALPDDPPVVVQRPVRSPHHTASPPAIIGGGTIPRPGDVSLAHRGILFLDEMPEFNRDVLETLRQPLEDGEVTVARSRASVKFPARFMLVGALNPTRRGGMPDDPAGHRDMQRYLARLSGPLLDRIDMHVEVPEVPYKQLSSTKRGTDSATIRQRVAEARAVQYARQGDGRTNADLTGRELDEHARMDDAAKNMLGQAINELNLSARAYDKLRRLSRTIADLERSETIASHHVAEAVQYRLLDRMV